MLGKSENNRGKILCWDNWIPAVKDKALPRQHPTSRDNQTMFRSFKSLKMVRGVLYREVEESGQNRRQLVLPARFISKHYKGCTMTWDTLGEIGQCQCSEIDSGGPGCHQIPSHGFVTVIDALSGSRQQTLGHQW